MRRIHFLGISLATMCVFALSAASPARADNWSKTYRLTGRPNLHITTNDAHIDLFSSASSQIDAQVTTTGWSIGEHGVKITESQSGNDVTIDVRVPSTNWNFFGGFNRSVKLQLRVPRDADMDVETGDGSVTSEAFHGQLRISTGDGSIEAHGLAGDVRLHSGDGHIDVSGRFDGLTLESGDGSVTAQANAGSRLGTGWSLRSGDGSVTLRLAEGLNADLDAHTGDGRVYVDFPVTVSGEISHTSVRGKIGAGGPTLFLHSGDGSIHIEKI